MEVLGNDLKNLAIIPALHWSCTVSGKTSWRERGIGEILTKAKHGDIIIAAEVSRLGRSTLQVLEILEEAAQQGVSVHIAKNNMVLDGSMQATITATVLGLAAQIEREFISARTKKLYPNESKTG